MYYNCPGSMQNWVPKLVFNKDGTFRINFQQNKKHIIINMFALYHWSNFCTYEYAKISYVKYIIHNLFTAENIDGERCYLRKK